MNDRGLSLSLPEMLKGYVLAKIGHEGDQRDVNNTWKAHMQRLRDIGEDEDVDFFKDWLRACHAESIRPGKKGAENKDYERIGSEFHRWVREHKRRLGLRAEDGFIRFVKRDLDFYAQRYAEIRLAAATLTPGWESIRYMSNVVSKQEAHKLIDQLPADATWEDLMREIYVRAAIDKGLEDSRSGRTKEVSEIRAKYGLAG